MRAAVDFIRTLMQGWNMAFTDKSQKVLTAREVDERIADRLPADQALKVQVLPGSIDIQVSDLGLGHQIILC